MDTIFALATAQGRSGVAVIRISGPNAQFVASQLCNNVPEVRGIRKLWDHEGVLLDEALVLNFSGKKSFTGEPIVEFQTHGSPAIISSVLRELSKFKDVRLADPGEFTRRAFENGKLDLSQIEGLSDLLNAETEQQRRHALRVFSGELGDKVKVWREKLIRATALLEATIDFVDEEVPIDVYPEVSSLIDTVEEQIIFELEGISIAERLREGFEVAIIGSPNVGKSTFLNKLAGREAAITSQYAGTTRDIIEVKMDLKGIPVTFLDTAGLRHTTEEVEKIGIEKSIQRAKMSDLRIYMKEVEEDHLIDLKSDDITVWSKCDLFQKEGLSISGHTGKGVDKLVNKIISILSNKVSFAGAATRERHRVSLLQASSLITDVRNKINQGFSTDFVSEDLRMAIQSINSLIGIVNVDDVLDEIFSNFCIGK